jgi:protein-S-isoprenylcysteine O-methyltransferase Ste14
LITGGPFRWSRNPMYVGLSVVYLGVSVLVGSAWPLVLLGVPLGFLRLFTIPVEEQSMREAFGPEYLAYATRVRRWL